MGHMNKNLIVILLIIFASLTRLIPHPANFTGLGAIGLFGGYYLRDVRWSFIAVMGAMVLSDVLLGFHPLMPVIYGALTLSILMGHYSRNSNKKIAILSGVAVSTLSLIHI